ncbi:hypothetical protein [Streptomyces sp. NPDC127084]
MAVLAEMGQRMVIRTGDRAEQGTGTVLRRLFRRRQLRSEAPV